MDLRSVKRGWVSRAILLGRKQTTDIAASSYVQSRSFSALNYVEEMRSSWKNDPSSVHSTWNDFFKKQQSTESAAPASAVNSDPDLLQKVASDHIRMLLLVRSYQVCTFGQHRM